MVVSFSSIQRIAPFIQNLSFLGLLQYKGVCKFYLCCAEKKGITNDITVVLSFPFRKLHLILSDTCVLYICGHSLWNYIVQLCLRIVPVNNNKAVPATFFVCCFVCKHTEIHIVILDMSIREKCFNFFLSFFFCGGRGGGNSMCKFETYSGSWISPSLLAASITSCAR